MFDSESQTESKKSNMTILVVLLVVLGLFLGATWIFTS